MKTFRAVGPENLIFGNGSISQIGTVIKDELLLERVAIVTDRFLYENGITKKAEAALKEKGVATSIWPDALPNPTFSNCMLCYEFLKEKDVQAVVVIGGGSAMDVAKGAASLLRNPPPLEQYIDKIGSIKKASIPVITVPTTAGTGSESTTGALLVNDETHIKGRLKSPFLTARFTIVDPELMISLPPGLTASSGLDALAHGVEGFTGKDANPIGDVFHKESIRLIGANIRKAVFSGSNLEARYNMALGAFYAGRGLGATSCAGSHALAYPIESKVKVTHGVANAVMLPAVTRFNVVADVAKYKEVAILLGEDVCGLPVREAAFRAADAIANINKDLKVPTLSQLGVKEADLEGLAKIAITMRRLIDNNPRPMTEEDIIAIYKESL